MTVSYLEGARETRSKWQINAGACLVMTVGLKYGKTQRF